MAVRVDALMALELLANNMTRWASLLNCHIPTTTVSPFFSFSFSKYTFKVGVSFFFCALLDTYRLPDTQLV